MRLCMQGVVLDHARLVMSHDDHGDHARHPRRRRRRRYDDAFCSFLRAHLLVQDRPLELLVCALVGWGTLALRSRLWYRARDEQTNLDG
ncbi:hypothetical protein EXIGLDRAFT_526009 [Exidia glandulosa HHB12029]|uniref:Uncharacterized protein n=1 Tax=Exidia glandulosa HHB12029 TaxID=1314781 RepID=A0A165J060_EXIGL|nr:hypothetical protein EXIGLDRAFT_526009 [Exidia glandulosa HHB12029]